MFTRREIVTHGTVGAFAAAALPAHADAAPAQDNGADVIRELKVFEQIVQKPLTDGLASNTLAFGYVPRLRELYTNFWKANQKFPDFCDVGTSVFYDIYDWHIKHREPLQIGRNAENRLTIRFMFTTLIVRLDADAAYFGMPFDQR